ncbi:hypothetical protein Bca52824_034223 [Brassica carinata]|uniref:Uncharacterized protein n=1 Tax=Brassica carinata TaxID=52824 RepID=A0A8X7SFY4_BRACI|nr:hypothetical protein Bca52824_034223 [Brassica carinata]
MCHHMANMLVTMEVILAIMEVVLVEDMEVMRLMVREVVDISGTSSGAYAEGSTANAGAAGCYNGSSGYGSGNTYGSNNGGFSGDNQFGGNPVSNSSQFGGDSTQFGSMEKAEMENGSVGDYADETDVAKRA